MVLTKLSDQIEKYTGKTALVRANFDVPLNQLVVSDTTRLEDALSTIQLLQANQCPVVLLAHLGRPEAQYQKNFSLKPVANSLSQLLNQSVSFIPYATDYHQLKPQADAKITLLDNLRFYKEEEANDINFSEYLASLGQFYVNQAFANCHRPHASMVGIPRFLPSLAGLNLAKEIEILNQVTTNPTRPLVVVIGGAKLETKIPLVNRFLPLADTILVGGKLAAEMKLLPNLDPKIKLAQLTEDGFDISTTSAQAFADLIHAAGTVIWNGSMGKFEDPKYQQGTKIVAEAINTTPAFTVVGGGDTETALTVLNLESSLDYISTGGGAMLSYLSDNTLVALEPLRS